MSYEWIGVFNSIWCTVGLAVGIFLILFDGKFLKFIRFMKKMFGIRNKYPLYPLDNKVSNTIGGRKRRKIKW